MTDASATRPTPPRRSWFLVAAILFADGWLYATGLDGALSILDDLLKAYAGTGLLTDLRQVVALSVIALLPVMFLVLVLTPPLPRRIFIPAFLCTIWANFIVWPVSAGPEPLSAMPLSIAQLVVFLLSIFWIYKRTGRFSLMASDLPVRKYLLRRILLGAGAGLVSLALIIVALVGFGVKSRIERDTAGYVTFSPKGIAVSEKTLTRGDKSVRLVGMVHIGDDTFYKSVFASFPRDALVLVEGVSDREGRIKGKMDYTGVAKALGLANQVELQTSWIESAVSEEKGEASDAPRPVPLMNADIDVSEFSEPTFNFLRDTAEVYDAGSLSDSYARMSALGTRYTEAQAMAAFDELIDKRNAHVLTTFDQQIATRDQIVIPWGAQHMPGLEKGLLDRGFAVTGQHTRLVISFLGLVGLD